jgi:3-methyladenine DNA glycosylase AlkC
MSNLLKDLYNQNFYNLVADTLSEHLVGFDKPSFLSEIYIESFPELELKQRTTHTADVFAKFMPADFRKAPPILLAIIEAFESLNITSDNLPFLFLPEYVERYGIDHFRQATAIIEKLTPFITCEFAVRPFLIRYQSEMTEQMYLWTQHSHRRVRRLASEGARPRLPWGVALNCFKEDPSPLLLIYEKLMDDECEWVRKSVANSLNDVAKDNPEVVISFASRYLGMTKQRDQMIKHACRTLLKRADPTALSLFGYNSSYFKLNKFELLRDKVQIGRELEFCFDLTNVSEQNALIRLEYAIGFLKANGKQSKKVFKISERLIEANGKLSIIRKQSFKAVSTRRLYPGTHTVSLILNGKEFATLPFELKG